VGVHDAKKIKSRRRIRRKRGELVIWVVQSDLGDHFDDGKSNDDKERSLEST